jgi:hypothetical protein
MRKAALPVLVVLALAGLALAAVGGSLGGSTRWSPDALFYQARVLQLQGADRDQALDRAFFGPLGAELRARDPQRSGNRDWVSYNAQFYDRRLTVPAAAAAIEPIAGDRAVLDVSLAGYLVTVLALFGLLLLRFRLPVAAGVAAATLFLPALVRNSSFPLTDSWGLALEIAAFAAAILVLRRGQRWLIGWAAAILLLALTRDSMWVPVLAAGWLAFRERTRPAIALAATGVAAALPPVLAIRVPMRELLGQMTNGLTPDPGASWTTIAGRYPGALVDMIHADGGFVRQGAWYTALFLIAGLAALFALGRDDRDPHALTLMRAGAVAGIAYVVAVPVFSAFRLELILVPMAAFGVALAAERIAGVAGVPAALPRLGRTPVLTGDRGSS